MRIYGSIQSNSVLAEPFLVTTNKSYVSKSTGRTEAGVLADKVIVAKNLRGTTGTLQHDTHFSVAMKLLSLLFGAAKHFVANSRTGESNTANETKYLSIQ